MYKTILEFPRWEINEKGHIRNVKTKADKYVCKNKQGYMHVQFKKDAKTYCRKVHRLVAELFLPEPEQWLVDLCESKHPYKVCINHIDHDKTNNHVTNLEWCDIAYNNKVAMDAGVVPALKGSLNGRAILTESLVHEMCKAFEQGMQPKEAVEKFKVSRQQATKIRSGHAWYHVWEQYDIEVKRRKSKIATEKFNDHEGETS